MEVLVFEWTESPESYALARPVVDDYLELRWKGSAGHTIPWV